MNRSSSFAILPAILPSNLSILLLLALVAKTAAIFSAAVRASDDWMNLILLGVVFAIVSLALLAGLNSFAGNIGVLPAEE